MVHSEEFEIQSGDGSQLFARRWLPSRNPKALMVIVHGLGEHSGRFQNYANTLIPGGIAVYGVDWRGHGRTKGQRGYIPSWAAVQQDVRAILSRAKADFSETPVFLFGHSLGGLIVLDYALDNTHELSGVITSAPGLKNTAVPEYLLLIARLLSHILPALSLETQLDPNGISRIPEEILKYKQDPYVHGKGTPRLGAEAQAAMKRVNSSAEKISLPLLIVHGEADPLVPIEGSALFFDRVRFADKERIVYPGGFHELHNDLCSQEVSQAVLDWMLERV